MEPRGSDRPATTPWPALIDQARHYPSPHNSQPIVVQPTSPTTATVFYDLDRGLPAESFGIPFAHVCGGVFLAGLAIVARAAGFAVRESLDLAAMDFGGHDRLHRLADVVLEPHETTTADRDALDAFLSRQTSRRPYDATTVDEEVLAGARAIAASHGHLLRSTTEAAVVDDLVRINQETLFDDLQDDSVHDEIMTWLRFSKREAAETGDGLSAETMLMPGPVLRVAMGHRGLWTAPVVGDAVRRVYLGTMRGVRQLAWLEGPFAGPADHVEAGRAFLEVWLELSRHGVALHPFGTVITNPRSHAAFVRAVDVDEDAGRMAWMLFRLGRSAPPPVAHRRPAAAMTIPAGARR
jgi:hypothetical protein